MKDDNIERKNDKGGVNEDFKGKVEKEKKGKGECERRMITKKGKEKQRRGGNILENII